MTSSSGTTGSNWYAEGSTTGTTGSATGTGTTGSSTGGSSSTGSTSSGNLDGGTGGTIGGGTTGGGTTGGGTTGGGTTGGGTTGGGGSTGGGTTGGGTTSGSLQVTGMSEDTGLSNSDRITNDNTPTFSGTAPAGANIELVLNSTVVGSGTADSQGNWTAGVSQALADGPYFLMVRTDTGLSTTTMVQIDTAAPTVAFGPPENMAGLAQPMPEYTVDPTPLASAHGSDNMMLIPKLHVDIDLDKDGNFAGDSEIDFTVADFFGTYSSFNLNELPEGNFNLRARLEDAAGNVGMTDPFLIHNAFDVFDVINGGGGAVGGNGGGGQVGGAGAQHGDYDQPAAPGSWRANHEHHVMLDTFGSEVEPNDTQSTANGLPAIPTDGSKIIISGAIATTSDEDWFSFSLSARTGMFIDIDSRETGLSTTLDSFVEVVDDGGSVVDDNDDGYDFDTGLPAQQASQDKAASSGLDSSLYVDLDPGDYAIHLTAAAGSGAYQLLIRASTDYSNTVPALDSNPGAPATIFLDFDGDSDDNDWGSYSVPAFDWNGDDTELTPGEKETIRNIWRAVSEDYSPFNINISTTYSGVFDDRIATHAVINNDDGSAVGASGALGVAFLDSFANGGPDDQPYFVFAKNFFDNQDVWDLNADGGASGIIEALALEMGNTTSHEGGHTFGLLHFGANNPQPNSIMQTPDTGLNMEAWRAGMTKDDESPVIFQDDMAVISNSTNGFGYRVDDFGDNRAGAFTLTNVGTQYAANGIISVEQVDHDWFRFRAAGGGISTITVDVDDYLNDLDTIANLYDAVGNLLVSMDPTTSFDATIQAILTNGDYFLEVAGTNQAGSAGQYTVLISLPNVPTPSNNLPPDANEPNNTSDRATNMGVLSGAFALDTASINNQLTGYPDYDWYRWTVGATGRVTVSMDVTGGPLELSIWTLSGSTLVQLGSTQTSSGATVRVSADMAAGAPLLVQVKGQNTSFGTQAEGGYVLGLQLV